MLIDRGFQVSRRHLLLGGGALAVTMAYSVGSGHRLYASITLPRVEGVPILSAARIRALLSGPTMQPSPVPRYARVKVSVCE